MYYHSRYKLLATVLGPEEILAADQQLSNGCQQGFHRLDDQLDTSPLDLQFHPKLVIQ